jgi:hypothetical protein
MNGVVQAKVVRYSFSRPRQSKRRKGRSTKQWYYERYGWDTSRRPDRLGLFT